MRGKRGRDRVPIRAASSKHPIYIPDTAPQQTLHTLLLSGVFQSCNRVVLWYIWPIVVNSTLGLWISDDMTVGVMILVGSVDRSSMNCLELRVRIDLNIPHTEHYREHESWGNPCCWGKPGSLSVASSTGFLWLTRASGWRCHCTSQTDKSDSILRSESMSLSVS